VPKPSPAMTARARGTGTRQPQVSEKQEQAAIVELLRSVGGWVYVLGTRRPRGDSHHGTCQTPGIPDLYAFVPNRRSGPERIALWVEVKTPTGRPSEAQEDFEHSCRVSGTHHVMGGCDDVADWLKLAGLLR
jgi:hypothetical protein